MLISAPILCLVCQQKTTRLERHLERVHLMTLDRYRRAFPAFEVVAVELVECPEVDGRAQLPPGARRCDGRDADRARQYQRDRRAGLKRPAEDPAPRPRCAPWNAEIVADLVARYLAGRLG